MKIIINCVLATFILWGSAFAGHIQANPTDGVIYNNELVIRDLITSKTIEVVIDSKEFVESNTAFIKLLDKLMAVDPFVASLIWEKAIGFKYYLTQSELDLIDQSKTVTALKVKAPDKQIAIQSNDRVVISKPNYLKMKNPERLLLREALHQLVGGEDAAFHDLHVAQIGSYIFDHQDHLVPYELLKVLKANEFQSDLDIYFVDLQAEESPMVRDYIGVNKILGNIIQSDAGIDYQCAAFDLIRPNLSFPIIYKDRYGSDGESSFEHFSYGFELHTMFGKIRKAIHTYGDFDRCFTLKRARTDAEWDEKNDRLEAIYDQMRVNYPYLSGEYKHIKAFSSQKTRGLYILADIEGERKCSNYHHQKDRIPKVIDAYHVTVEAQKEAINLRELLIQDILRLSQTEARYSAEYLLLNLNHLNALNHLINSTKIRLGPLHSLQGNYNQAVKLKADCGGGKDRLSSSPKNQQSSYGWSPEEAR